MASSGVVVAAVAAEVSAELPFAVRGARTSPRRSSRSISAASHRTHDAKWDWLDKRTKTDTDMRLRKLGITNS